MQYFQEQEVIRPLCVLVEQGTGGLSSLLLYQHIANTFLPQSVCHPGRTEASFKIRAAKCCCKQELAKESWFQLVIYAWGLCFLAGSWEARAAGR